MQIPFVDLSNINVDIVDRVVQVIHSGKFINGLEVASFEVAWAKYCDAKHCVATSSGSSALTAAIKSLLPQGSKIVIPEFSFAATLFSVLEAGCVPVFCPVKNTGLMDTDACSNILDDLAGPRSRPGERIGVMPVHLFGQVVDLPKDLFRVNAFVIEDACQAHGMKALSEIACFSFYPTKNLGAMGDAGAVVTNSELIAEAVYKLCNYGDSRGAKYQHHLWGTNARMDEIQAAVLNVKLRWLDRDNAIRRQQAFKYMEFIPTIATAEECYYHLYPILIDHRYVDEAHRFLLSKGIEVGRHYPYTLPKIYNRQEYYSGTASLLAAQVVTLPIGPHLNDSQINYVIDVFQTYFMQEAGGLILRPK